MVYNITRVLLISRYPEQGKKHTYISGIASYTKNLLTFLAENIDFTVFADKIGKWKESYKENNTEIFRIWSNVFSLISYVIKQIRSIRNKIDIVHIQYDMFLYGGFFSIILFPFLLIILKIMKKPIIITLHSVIQKNDINGNFLKGNKIKGNVHILQTGYYLLVKVTSLFVNAIIVHENYFKEILIKNYKISGQKIFVIPHGIEEVLIDNVPDKIKTREFLELDKSKRMLLFFGYITGYKGIRSLIEAYSYLDKSKYFLVIAGGKHPRLKDNPEYIQYIEELKSSALKISDNIIFTEFVPENEIGLYFVASDLVLFPYTFALWSSGPMSLAIAYNKPFLVSEAFKDAIPLQEIIFKNESKTMASKIEEFFNDKGLEKKIFRYNETLKREKNWGKVAKTTAEVYKTLAFKKV